MDFVHKVQEDFGIVEDFVVVKSENQLNCLVPTSWIEANSKNVPEALPSIPDNLYKGVHKSLASLILSRSTAKQQLDKFVPVIVNVVRKDSRIVESLVEEELCMGNASLEIINAHIKSHVDFLQRKAFEKEAREKYPNAYLSQNSKNKKKIIKNHDSLIVEVLKKLYGRKPVFTEKYVECITAEATFCQTDDTNFEDKSSKTDNQSVGQFFVSHPSLHPVYFVAETSIAYFVFQPYFRHTLADVVAFSPQMLSEISCKMLVFFEILMAVRHLHSIGINVHNLRLSDFSVDEMLWVRIISLDFNNFFKIKSSDTKSTPVGLVESLTHLEVSTFPMNIKATMPDLPQIVELWINGEISNLEYLMVLNKLAGRSFDEPNHHPILPWVLDISNQSRATFRDLTKSKYRLNKGDTQLDLTFDSTNPESMMNHPDPMPFHVSDFLSDITYYVYVARRNPQDVLCRIVRPKWQSSHYPPSVCRMYEWTPDECIPAFYLDPNVFRTCHEDLSDLQVPFWSSNPREFISIHRAALESSEVSKNLHHWIDVTFGCRLSGIAAVESKNVCLQLVDKHDYLVSHGVVQLFTTPHPERQSSNSSERFSSKYPHVLKAYANDVGNDGNDDGVVCDLNDSTACKDDGRRDEDGDEKKMLEDSVADLNHLEKFFNFCLKETHLPSGTVMENKCDEIDADDLKSSLTSRDMQTLGCLAVELFCGKTLSSLSPDKPSLLERCDLARSLAFNGSPEFPFFIKKCTGYLLNLPPMKQRSLNRSDSEFGAAFTYPAINSPNDLPPPTIEILLASQMGVLAFPNYVNPLYGCLSTFHSLVPAFEDCPHLITPRGIQHLGHFLKNFFEMECNKHNVVIYKIVHPYVEFLMRGSLGTEVKISSAWNLFYFSSKCCSETKQTRDMLGHMLNIFKMEDTSPSFLKLYHRTFISQMISTFKLKVFLNHFSTLLVEAISGFRNFPTVEKDIDKNCIEMMQEQKIKDVDDKNFGDYMKNDEMDKFEREQDLLFPDENEDELEDNKSIKSGCPSTNSFDDDELSSKSDSTQPRTDAYSRPSYDEECSPPTKEDLPKVGDELQREEEKEEESHATCNISDVAKETAVWLCDKIGPVLTAKYISRNLLRMLVICYIPPQQLEPITPSVLLGFEACATEKYILGDLNAVELASCLLHISRVHGEQVILVQYLQHIKELITSLATSKLLSSKREGYIISSITLLLVILPHIHITSLIDLLEVLEVDIIFPILHLLSSEDVKFSVVSPSGRSFAAFRLVDIIALISMRLGFEMSRCKIMHVIKKFFDGFQVVEKFFSDGNFQNNNADEGPETMQPSEVATHRRQQSLDAVFREGVDPAQQQDENKELMDLQASIQKQLINTYTCELAHCAYVTFCKLAGGICIEQHLENDDLLRRMCAVYDASIAISPSQTTSSAVSDPKFFSSTTTDNSDGENVTVEGNKIIIKSPLTKQQTTPSTEERSVDATWKRMLRGNWLAYWGHEVGFGDRPHPLNFKQMKLQTFKGHTSSVKCMKVMDCENSFLSAGKDHTVKLWSLRNQGDGSARVPCQATYSQHKKSIFSLIYIDSLNQVASSDGSVHIWDPFNMLSIRKVVSSKSSPVTVLAGPPSPSSLLFTSSNESIVRIIDCRLGKFSHYLKTTSIPSGHIRSMAVSDNGHHMALGFNTGIISTLDIRSGGYISSWKAYDSDILEMKIFGDNSILAFSFDLGANIWSSPSGKQSFALRGMYEGAKWINHSNQTGLVFGYPSNKIAICPDFDGNQRQADLSSIKLKSDLIKGSLSCLALLPLNHSLLLASDHGDITLVA